MKPVRKKLFCGYRTGNQQQLRLDHLQSHWYEDSSMPLNLTIWSPTSYLGPHLRSIGCQIQHRQGINSNCSSQFISQNNFWCDRIFCCSNASKTWSRKTWGSLSNEWINSFPSPYRSKDRKNRISFPGKWIYWTKWPQRRHHRGRFSNFAGGISAERIKYNADTKCHQSDIDEILCPSPSALAIYNKYTHRHDIK